MHCCFSKNCLDIERFLLLKKNGNFFFFSGPVPSPKAGSPPHSHTSVIGTSWGCFFPFSSLCFGGRGKPKLYEIILGAVKARGSQVKEEGKRGSSLKR